MNGFNTGYAMHVQNMRCILKRHVLSCGGVMCLLGTAKVSCVCGTLCTDRLKTIMIGHDRLVAMR